MLEEPAPLVGQVHRAAAIRVGKDRGEPLRQERSRVAQARRGESASRVGMRVDEPWRHIEPGGIHDLVRVDVAEIADGGDPISPEENVRPDPRIPHAIENTSVPDQDRTLLS
jgi:hypothetical protein